MLRRETFLECVERAGADITKYDTDGGEGKHCGGAVVVKCIRIHFDRLHQRCFGELWVADRHWVFRDAALTSLT